MAVGWEWWGAMAYLGCASLLAARLRADERTADWPWPLVLWASAGWPVWLLLVARHRAAALLRRAEVALLTRVFMVAQRRLARLGCTFSVEP